MTEKAIVKVEPPIVQVQERSIMMPILIALVTVIMAMLGWFAAGISNNLASHEKQVMHEGTRGLQDAQDKAIDALLIRVERIERMHFITRDSAP